jgi:hypothetical protein
LKKSPTNTCEDLYGEGKADFFNTVESNFTARVLSKGFIVESLYLIGKPRLPPQVEKAITMKIDATQKQGSRTSRRTG